MITGLCIDIPSKELKEHLAGMARYHEKKAKWYKSQAAVLVKGGASMGARGSNDPVRSLEESERGHREKAAYFRFMEQHLVKNETYRLTQEDLARIELASRYYPGVHY